MDDMTRHQGEQAMTYEDVMTYVHNTGRTYWIGRFYKNYNGLLDAYIHFAHSDRYSHFILDYDPQHVHIGEDYGGYPTAAHFYLARSAIMTGTSWTIAEYDALAPNPMMAPLPVVPIVALAPIADMQGGVAIEDDEAAIVAAPVTVPAANIEEEETIPAANWGDYRRRWDWRTMSDGGRL